LSSPLCTVPAVEQNIWEGASLRLLSSAACSQDGCTHPGSDIVMLAATMAVGARSIAELSER